MEGFHEIFGKINEKFLMVYRLTEKLNTFNTLPPQHGPMAVGYDGKFS